MLNFSFDFCVHCAKLNKSYLRCDQRGEKLLEVKGLTKSFNNVMAVSDVSFSVEPNSYVSLLGASGCGKSVLLRIIAGLLAPDEGAVYLNERDITFQPCNERQIGFVQQKYALFPHLNVFDNIAFGLRYRAINPVTDEAIVRKEVSEIIGLVGLSGQEHKMIGQISGGQKQRVSLSRTLVTRPSICLLDEPLGALDANLRERMTIELQNIRSELGISFMHVTGNEFEALAMGQKMLVMEEGQIVRQGKPQDLYNLPLDLATAKSMHSFNIFSGALMLDVINQAQVQKINSTASAKASFCALPMDKINIQEGKGAETGIPVEFITNEFLGNKTIYFFKTACGHICEVQEHMGLTNPRNLNPNTEYYLQFAAENILLYDEDQLLIN